MKNKVYLRMIAIVICFLCLISATACDLSDADDKTENPTVNNNDRNNGNPQLVGPLAPSIQAGSIDEIVSLLKNADIKSYGEECQAAYQKLFSTLSQSGYIYSVDTTNGIDQEDAVTLFEKDGSNIFYLMPYARYEDIGIYSYVIFRKKLYQICIYNADEEFLSQDGKTSEYLKNRLEWNVLDEVTAENTTVCFMSEGGTAYHKNCAGSFLDRNHYYVVKTEAPQDELKAFLEVLRFEKVSID